MVPLNRLTAPTVLAAALLWGPGQADAQARSATRDADAAHAAHPAIHAASDPVAELEAIRAATAKYRDVEVALADGYIREPTNMCVTSEMEGLPRQLGGMGIHFFRPDLVGITGTEPRVAGAGVHEDFLQPSVLIYEPGADGSLELVAVENIIFRAGWEAAGHQGAPEFMGNQYYHMVDNPGTEADEAHGFEEHYELHLWVHRDNPSGVFAQFNPAVTCEHHTGGGQGGS